MTNQLSSTKLAVVTLHDAAPRFSNRVFEYMDTFDNLKIEFNVRLVHFYVIQRTFPDILNLWISSNRTDDAK